MEKENTFKFVSHKDVKPQAATFDFSEVSYQTKAEQLADLSQQKVRVVNMDYIIFGKDYKISFNDLVHPTLDTVVLKKMDSTYPAYEISYNEFMTALKKVSSTHKQPLIENLIKVLENRHTNSNYAEALIDIPTDEMRQYSLRAMLHFPEIIKTVQTNPAFAKLSADQDNNILTIGDNTKNLQLDFDGLLNGTSDFSTSPIVLSYTDTTDNTYNAQRKLVLTKDEFDTLVTNLQLDANRRLILTSLINKDPRFVNYAKKYGIAALFSDAFIRDILPFMNTATNTATVQPTQTKQVVKTTGKTQTKKRAKEMQL